jgi:hypothetical protein
MIPPQFFHPLARVSSPSQVEQTPPPVSDATDEAIARLEKLIIEERIEREAKEAAREAAMAKAAADKLAAEERAAADKKIADEAAAKATAIARAEAKAETERIKAEAENKAAEEAVKAKKAAEEGAAKAAAEAAAAATEAANAAAAEAVAAATAAATAAARKAPLEKKKPIKFKDAVGRKFSFPFHLCNTWQVCHMLLFSSSLELTTLSLFYDYLGHGGSNPTGVPPRRCNWPACRRRAL